MHEMGIASSILEAVANEAERHPGTRPVGVGIRVGELSAIDPESLRFCFEALITDTDLAQLRLEIEMIPRKHRCAQCGDEFVVKDYDCECPRCRVLSAECVSGDELEIAFLEVEEDGSSAVGTKGTERE